MRKLFIAAILSMTFLGAACSKKPAPAKPADKAADPAKPADPAPAPAPDAPKAEGGGDAGGEAPKAPESR